MMGARPIAIPQLTEMTFFNRGNVSHWVLNPQQEGWVLWGLGFQPQYTGQNSIAAKWVTRLGECVLCHRWVAIALVKCEVSVFPLSMDYRVITVCYKC